jgi:hypothetical protein
MLPQNYAILHRFMDEPVLQGHMSRNARELLNIAVSALAARGINQNATAPLIAEFGRWYHPTLYEDAALQWDPRDLRKAFEGQFKGTKLWKMSQDDILKVCTLNGDVIRQWGLNQSAKTQFRFSHSGPRMDIYYYVTHDFLFDDFSEPDLLKLSEIARDYDRSGGIKDVMDACKRVTSPDKRFISYIYRVLKNEDRIESAIAAENERLISRSETDIAELLRAQRRPPGYRMVHDPSWVKDIEVSRQMDEAEAEDPSSKDYIIHD